MRLRASFIGIALFAGAITPIAGVPGVACAGEQDSAALVVDLGDEGGVLRYCVNLPDGSVTGAELIQLAGQQHGLDHRIDPGGGVCRLAGVGPASGDCFGDYPYFWGYWRGDANGGWTWSSLGAGSTSVEPGDVEGWAWGTGQDGSSHPKPPQTTYTSVCGGPSEEEAGGADPEEKPADQEPDDPGASAEEGGAAGVADPEASADETSERPRSGDGTRKKGSKKGAGDPPAEAAEPSVPVTAPESPSDQEPPASATGSATSGPPAAGIAGLVVAGLLAAAGAVTGARRRRRGMVE